MTLTRQDAIEWANLYKKWDTAARERYLAAFTYGNTVNSLASELYHDEQAVEKRGANWHQRAQAGYESGLALTELLPAQSARYSRAVGRESATFDEVELREIALAEQLRKPGTNRPIGARLDSSYKLFPVFARRAYARAAIFAAINKYLTKEELHSDLVGSEDHKSVAARDGAELRWHFKLKAQVEGDLHVARYVAALDPDNYEVDQSLPNIDYFPATDDPEMIPDGEITNPYDHPWIEAALAARKPPTHFPMVVFEPIKEPTAARPTVDTPEL